MLVLEFVGFELVLLYFVNSVVERVRSRSSLGIGL